GEVLVEEFLQGPEVSLFFVSDGRRIVALSPAQDYKRAYDDDEGPNTGGMGAYSPLPWLDADFVDTVTTTIAQPVIDELAGRGTPAGRGRLAAAADPVRPAGDLRHPGRDRRRLEAVGHRTGRLRRPQCR
ncbi:hypothetical protein EBU58_14495, partial [bacterium]|nr:hypothetical protein [bacterium]